MDLRWALTLLIRLNPRQFVHGSSWWWQSQVSFSSHRTGQDISLCGGHEPVARSGDLQGYKVYGERVEGYPSDRDTSAGRDTSALSPPPCNTMLPNKHPNRPCLVVGLPDFKESTVSPRSRAVRSSHRRVHGLQSFLLASPERGSTPQPPHCRAPHTLTGRSFLVEGRRCS